MVDWISTLISKRMPKYERVVEVPVYCKYFAGAAGVLIGAGLAWRWMRRRRRRAMLAVARERKRRERTEAFERLKQQIEENNLSSAQVETITKLTTKELLSQLKTNHLTAVEVLTAYQIKALQVHQRTNCVVEPILEALEWAKELDKSTSKGPLHGLPVSLKECIGIKGYDVTAGCSKWIGDPCQDDAAVVKVLKQQGAIPFMRTNIPQTMLSYENTNPIFGATVNPHNPKRSPGGSSGGEGALIAGGGSVLGVGTDLGGSIRYPGSACGIPAFKPTSPRVSKKGGRAVLVGKNIQSSWGPLGRDVNSLIMFLKSVLVPEMHCLDPALPVMPFKDEVLNEKRPLRIGYLLFNGVFEVVPAMKRAVIEAKELLEAAGHQLIPWEEDFGSILELFVPCLFADGGREIQEILEFDEVDDAMRVMKQITSLPLFVRKFLAFVTKPFNPELSAKLKAICGLRTASDLWNAVKEIKILQDSIIERWQNKKLDAIICPAFGCPALSNGLIQHLSGIMTYTAVFNILDFPSGCVPVTVVSKQDEAEMEQYPRITKQTKSHQILKKDMKGTVGLPVSAQVVTLPWQDELCLRVMNDMEEGVKQNTKHN